MKNPIKAPLPGGWSPGTEETKGRGAGGKTLVNNAAFSGGHGLVRGGRRGHDGHCGPSRDPDSIGGYRGGPSDPSGRYRRS